MKKILALCMSIIMVFSLSACGAPSPTETVTSFLTALQKGEPVGEVYVDPEMTLSQDFVTQNSDYEDFNENQKNLADDFLAKLKEFEFTVSNEKIDGDKATVDVEIKTYNFGTQVASIMSEYIEEAMKLIFSDPTDEELEKLIEDIALKHLDKVEKNYVDTVKVELTKKDKKWVINELDEDSEVVNALLGNMIKTLNEIDDDFE